MIRIEQKVELILEFTKRNGQKRRTPTQDQNLHPQKVTILPYHILNRTQKDHASYFKESKQLEEKLEQLKAEEGQDPYNITKMEEQWAETAQMLPNTKLRIESAIEDLKMLMSANEGNEELKAGEDWKAAEMTLAEATAFVETI